MQASVPGSAACRPYALSDPPAGTHTDSAHVGHVTVIGHFSLRPLNINSKTLENSRLPKPNATPNDGISALPCKDQEPKYWYYSRAGYTHTSEANKGNGDEARLSNVGKTGEPKYPTEIIKEGAGRRVLQWREAVH